MTDSPSLHESGVRLNPPAPKDCRSFPKSLQPPRSPEKCCPRYSCSGQRRERRSRPGRGQLRLATPGRQPCELVEDWPLPSANPSLSQLPRYRGKTRRSMIARISMEDLQRSLLTLTRET